MKPTMKIDPAPTTQGVPEIQTEPGIHEIICSLSPETDITFKI